MLVRVPQLKSGTLGYSTQHGDHFGRFQTNTYKSKNKLERKFTLSLAENGCVPEAGFTLATAVKLSTSQIIGSQIYNFSAIAKVD